MLHVLPDLLPADTLAHLRKQLADARWQDGRQSAGYAAREQKSNQQLAVDDPLALDAGQIILDALSRHPGFISFALPLKILTPMFNRYRDGGEYGFHIDNALRIDPATGQRIRTDVSTTVFLCDPDEYEGGELVIQGTYGMETIKLPAGSAVLYPADSLHRVSPVTRGERIAAFFWTQSMVQDDSLRSLLFDLDQTIQRLALRPENAEEVTRLTGTYHNLVRRHASV